MQSLSYTLSYPLSLTLSFPAHGLLVSDTLSRYCLVVIYDAALDQLMEKVWEGGRINQQEALRLLET